LRDWKTTTGEPTKARRFFLVAAIARAGDARRAGSGKKSRAA
jgi:hypothetical protein